MTKEDNKIFGAKILGIAAGVRRVVLFGNRRIDEAIEASTYDDYMLEPLIEFADLLMQGYEKEYIIDRLQISSEIVESLDKMDMNW